MSLNECPSCGYDAIFVPLIPAVGYDGKLYGSKSAGFCNGHECDQLLWYYPHSGRVTRRTGGVTLEGWRKSRVDLTFINIIRRNEGMSALIEANDCAEPPPFLTSLTRPWYIRLQDTIENWFWYVVAAVKSPFLRRNRRDLDKAVAEGVLTINEARAAQATRRTK